jgi:signal transduction histidine kinase
LRPGPDDYGRQRLVAPIAIPSYLFITNNPVDPTVHMFRPYRPLYLLIALAIAIVVAAVAAFVFSPEYPYAFAERKFYANEPVIFHDFDYNGHSEAFHFVSRDADNVFPLLVVVKAANSGYIDQLRFRGENFLMDWTADYYADFNNDGSDEFIVFTKTAKTVLLHIRDLRNEEYLLTNYPLFVDSSTTQSASELWDVFAPDLYFVDVDEDGYKELLILGKSGYSLTPREILLFSIKEQRVLVRKSIYGIAMHLLTRSRAAAGETMFCLGTWAPGNMQRSDHFSDHFARLWFFDSQLRPSRPSEVLAMAPASVWPLHFTPSGDVLALVINASQKSLPSQLVQVGRKIGVDELYSFPVKMGAGFSLASLNWPAQVLIQGRSLENRSIFLLEPPDWQEARIVNIEEPLQFSPPSLTLQMPAGERLLLARVAYENAALFALNSDLEVVATFQSEALSSGFRAWRAGPLRRDGQSIALLGNASTRVIDFQPNMAYFYRYPLFFLLLLGIFGLLYGLAFALPYVLLQRSLWRILRLHDFPPAVLLSSGLQPLLVSRTIENHHPNWRRESLAQLTGIRQLNSAGNARDIESIPANGAAVLIKVHQLPQLQPLFLFLVKDAAPQTTQVWQRAVRQMAHEIKSPLSTVALRLSALSRILPQSGEDTAINEDIRIIEQELKEIRMKTQNFLKLMQVEQSKNEIISLPQLIEKARQRFAPYFEDGITLEYVEQTEDYILNGDQEQISQVIQIILENSIDAMQGQGLLKIVLSSEMLAFYKESARIVLEFHDTGPGIRAEDMDNVFAPGFSTKSQGNGIGLVIAKEIMQRHKGEITINSQPGIGTCVSLSWPRFMAPSP